jgi:hypothetical protein
VISIDHFVDMLLYYCSLREERGERRGERQETIDKREDRHELMGVQNDMRCKLALKSTAG